MTIIVGLNLSHDSSAALVRDRRLVAALSLERTSRVKRGVVPREHYPALMVQLIETILDSESMDVDDVDYWIASSTEPQDATAEERLLSEVGILVPRSKRLVLPHPGHHLAHASAAFFSTETQQATAVVVDAYGSRVGPHERERETAFLFSRGQPPLSVLSRRRSRSGIAGRFQDGKLVCPSELAGIGETYRAVTLALGFYENGTTYDDAGKTMGLAAFGERISPDRLFYEPGAKQSGLAAATLVDLGLAVPGDGHIELKPVRSPPDALAANVAAQLQSEFEEEMLALVATAVQRSGCTTVVAGGGCFLNSVANTRLAEQLELERFDVFPAATDDGNAAGAALYAANHLIDQQREPSAATAAVASIYLGPSRPRVAITELEQVTAGALKGQEHSSMRSAALSAARHLAQGEIVAWHEGRSEFGPRALGARSILCDPRRKDAKHLLNSRVKFREPFRPFAASVLAEHVGDWFDVANVDLSHMLFVATLAPGRQGQVPGVTHIDRTCRVHSVDASAPSGYRLLLEELFDLTGVPMVVNTSLNLRGQPITETAFDAVDVLLGSRIDRLFVDGVEIMVTDPHALVPIRSPSPAPDLYGLDATLLDLISAGPRPLAELSVAAGVTPDEAAAAAHRLRRTGAARWDFEHLLSANEPSGPQYEPAEVPPR